MPSCRICKQHYPQSQFVSGNGPRYLTCVRCAVEQGMVDPEAVPQLYSDELVNARMALFSRIRSVGFSNPRLVIVFSFGNGLGIWSLIFFVSLIILTLIAPVIHFFGSARFKANLLKLTP